MILRQLVYYSLLIGLAAGLVLTAVQRFQVVPIIFAAEAYEAAGGGEETSHESGGHHHGDEWAPEDGFERTFYTGFSNFLTALGFALILLSAMLIIQQRSADTPTRFDWKRALGWGLSGYAIFWLIPALGHPPEIPLQNAAELQDRQAWWVLCVVCSAAGIGGLVFFQTALRWFMPLLIAVPFLVGAPHPDGPMFIGHSAEATRALEALASRFVYATAVTNAVFWLVIGVATTWAGIRINLSLADANPSSSSSHAG